MTPELEKFLKAVNHLRDQGIYPTYYALSIYMGKSETYIRTLQQRLLRNDGPQLIVKRKPGVPKGVSTHSGKLKDNSIYKDKPELWEKILKGRKFSK